MQVVRPGIPHPVAEEDVVAEEQWVDHVSHRRRIHGDAGLRIRKRRGDTCNEAKDEDNKSTPKGAKRVLVRKERRAGKNKSPRESGNTAHGTSSSQLQLPRRRGP